MKSTIKSFNFWLAVFLIGIIPLLLVDISEHYLSWGKEVREELIQVVQNTYSLSRNEKAIILDQVFNRNQTLIILIILKSLISCLFLILSFILLRSYFRKSSAGKVKPVLIILFAISLFLTGKFLFITKYNTNPNTEVLTISKNSLTIKQAIADKFKGSIVYVDFWGTTCGPCLTEFRNFTKQIKERYKNEKVKYLYIAQGNEYLWKRQIEKYQVTGHHLFLDDSQYTTLYRNSINNPNSPITMPRYLILDRLGNIITSDAKRPSEKEQLFSQIDEYLKSY